jgi:hypothetical protein
MASAEHPADRLDHDVVDMPVDRDRGDVLPVRREQLPAAAPADRNQHARRDK